MHSIAGAAPLRAASTRRHLAGKCPAFAVRAMADAADAEEPPVQQLVDMRVGKVLKAYKHEDADKLYVEEVDVGEEEPRTICSGLVPYMAAEVSGDVTDRSRGRERALSPSGRPRRRTSSMDHQSPRSLYDGRAFLSSNDGDDVSPHSPSSVAPSHPSSPRSDASRAGHRG